MIVAIPYCQHDQAQADRWFQWTIELGGCAKHDLIVLPFKGMPTPLLIGWKSVTTLTDFSGVTSDWSGPGAVRDASGPNFSFREIAQHVFANNLGPWLFMEPDAIPLTPDWIDRIAADYQACGKSYMGARVAALDMPEHMSGIGVYPGDMPRRAPHYMNPVLATMGGRQVEVAFNLAGAKDALSDFAATRLIQQEWRHPAFTLREEAQGLIDNGRVIFHSDKSGSLIDLLKQSFGTIEIPSSKERHDLQSSPSLPCGNSVARESQPGSFAPSSTPDGKEYEDEASWIPRSEWESRFGAIERSIAALQSLFELNKQLSVKPAPVAKKRPALKPFKMRSEAEQAKINERMARVRAGIASKKAK